MSDHDCSRRDLLRTIGITLTLTGSGADVISAEAAQHVHQIVRAEKNGPYKPKALTTHEYQTLLKLSDIIIPADNKSKGAVEAGAPEFIDHLCSVNDELKSIYTGGLGWLDHEMTARHNAAFLDAQPGQQTALVDLIAYRKNSTPALAPGIQFFTWLRNMVVDAFYTSRIGMDDLGFMGNGAVAEFQVPREAVDYALKRSGMA